MIAIGQQETKVLDVPSEGEEENENEGGKYLRWLQVLNQETNSFLIFPTESDDEDGEGSSKKDGESASEEAAENGHGEDAPKETPVPTSTAAASSSTNDQPGTSTGVANGTSTNEEDEALSEANNLEVAWEILELAAIIFARQGESAYENLAEALTDLACISFENSHFDIAIKDYTKALEVHHRMEKTNHRRVAEVYFQIGLSYLMLNDFDESITALEKACDVLDTEVEAQKLLEQTEEVVAVIKDLEETKVEICLKIVEVEETKQMVSIWDKKNLYCITKTLLYYSPSKKSNVNWRNF